MGGHSFLCLAAGEIPPLRTFLGSPGTAARLSRAFRSAHRGQCLVGSLAGAAHLSKSNAGVPRSAQAERKSAVEQKGKSWLDRSLQCGRRPQERGLSILLSGVPSVEQEVSDKLPRG